MKEEWKLIEGYEEEGYEVSNMGNVRKNGVLKKLTGDGRGYLVTKLTKNGKNKVLRVHRLVAEAFCENDDPLNKTVVNHINEQRDCNIYTNLEWVTYQENTIHSRESISSSRKGKCGKKIICVELGIIFNTIKEASDYFHCNPSNVSDAVNNNRKVFGRYSFKFITEEKSSLKLNGVIIDDNNNYTEEELLSMFSEFLKEKKLIYKNY